MRDAKVLNIQVNANTDAMSLKLRTIAKHAEALANELDKIDSETCEECGGLLSVTKFTGDGETYTTTNCEQCKSVE